MNRTVSTVISIVAVIVLIALIAFFIRTDNEEFETSVGEDSIKIIGHDMSFEILYDDIGSIGLAKGYHIDSGFTKDFCNSKISIAHKGNTDVVLVYIDPTYNIRIDLISGPHYTINMSSDAATKTLYEQLESKLQGASA